MGILLGPSHSTDATTLIIKVKKKAKIRNQYTQVPHIEDIYGKLLLFVCGLFRLFVLMLSSHSIFFSHVRNI